MFFFSKHSDDSNMNKLKCFQLNIYEIWTDLELLRKKNSLGSAQTINNTFDILKWAQNCLIHCIYEIEISFNNTTHKKKTQVCL